MNLPRQILTSLVSQKMRKTIFPSITNTNWAFFQKLNVTNSVRSMCYFLTLASLMEELEIRLRISNPRSQVRRDSRFLRTWMLYLGILDNASEQVEPKSHFTVYVQILSLTNIPAFHTLLCLAFFTVYPVRTVATNSSEPVFIFPYWWTYIQRRPIVLP